MTPLREMALDGGRTLTLRLADSNDVPAMEALYQRLSIDDLQKRFFTGATPPRSTVEKWASVGERLDGVCLVVEQTNADQPPLIVAEAGFAPLPDGDAEMAITVDSDHRGWMGPWLLDALLEQAAAKGIPNLQALIAARNTRMRLMVCRRGASGLPDEDWTNIRLQISTAGDVPVWHHTSPSRRRLLVEASTLQWSGTSAANRLGYDVTVCTGPDGSAKACPLLEGEHCPLVDGADGVLVALPAEGHEDLLKAHAESGGPPTVVKLPTETSEVAVRRLTGLIDETESYYAADAYSWSMSDR